MPKLASDARLTGRACELGRNLAWFGFWALTLSACGSSASLEREISGLKAQVNLLRREQQMLSARLDSLREPAVAPGAAQHERAASSSSLLTRDVRPTLAVVRLEPGAAGTDPSGASSESAGSAATRGAGAKASPGTGSSGAEQLLKDGADSTDSDEPRPEIIVHGDQVKTRHVDETPSAGRAPARR